MKHVFSAAVVLGTALVLVSGCSRPEAREIRYEMTGDAGATANVTRVLPGDDGSPNSVTLSGEKLPMSKFAKFDEGRFEVSGTPTKGALTCRILVDGKEVAKKTGAPGQKVACETQVTQ
jgi:hypothetical protein